MTRFVQIIEYTTSKPDELSALSARWRDSRAGDLGGPDRISVLSDRGHPGRYLTIAEFDSYENAMENSGRADTSDFAAQMAALCDGPPTFRDLDLVEQWEPVAH
ncbi:MAG TPA: hypothetical protein VHO27_10440 [Angustibacter sp.]|nr:hypothetical protein [Angustibacter sp.]